MTKKVVRMLRKQGYVPPSYIGLYGIEIFSGAGMEPKNPY